MERENVQTNPNDRILVKILKTETSKTLIALCLLCFVLSVFRSSVFLTQNNLFNILRQTSINAIIAIGITFVLLTGGIDLSVGSVAGFASLVTAMLLVKGQSMATAMFVGLASGLTIGVVSGLLVAKLKIPPFIATLSMLTTFRGVIMVLSEGRPFTQLGDAFGFIGTGYIGIIPFPVVLMLVFVALAHYVLKHTRFGRYLYAIGGNEEAARLSGIKTDKIKILVYVISAFFATISGFIMAARVDSATPLAGDGAELDAIAAAVIGGVSLSGGKGVVIGTLIGSLIIGVLNNGMVLLDVSVFYTKIVKGLVILLAVIIDIISKKKHS